MERIVKTSLRHLLCFVVILFINSTILAQTITFQKETISTGINNNSGLAAADFDNDGDLDLVANSFSKNAVYWFRNDGGDPVVWTRMDVDDNFSGAQYVYSEDIDGDGKKDVLATGAVDAALVAWWHNNGGDPITWTKEIIREDFANAHGVFASDLNGDGHMDVIATAALGNLVCWWENDGNYPVNWIEHVIDNKAPVSQSVTAVDIDHDGDNDVLATSENSLFLYLNDGGNPVSWIKKTIDNNLQTAHWVETADFNSDGNLDIVACGFSETNLKWYENDGGEPIVWKAHTIPGDFFGSLTVTAADLNGDGRKDLLGTSLSRNEISWWSNDEGNPVNWTKHVINNYIYPWALITADIDEDGDEDVLSGSNTLGRIYLFENELNPTSVGSLEDNILKCFQLKQNYPNPFNPSTTIEFSIPEASQVKLDLFNLQGEKIKSIKDEYFSAGTHSMEFKASNLPSGIYFYRLMTNNSRQCKRMVLLK